MGYLENFGVLTGFGVLVFSNVSEPEQESLTNKNKNRSKVGV